MDRKRTYSKKWKEGSEVSPLPEARTTTGIKAISFE